MEEKTFGQKLKELRLLAGFTLRDIETATAAIISNAYLSQLENDKIKKPSANVLYHLAKVYGVNIEVILGAAGLIDGPKNTPFFSSYNITKDEESKLLEYLQFLRSRNKTSQEALKERLSGITQQQLEELMRPKTLPGDEWPHSQKTPFL